MIYAYLAAGCFLAVLITIGSAKLQAFANRQRTSTMDTAAVEPVKHTEDERAALWAELAPVDVEVPAEVAARLALERAEQYTASVLDGLERAVAGRLDALWALTREVCQQDEIDAEWAALASGEFLAVNA